MNPDLLNAEEIEKILSSISDEEMQQLRSTAETLFSSMSQQKEEVREEAEPSRNGRGSAAGDLGFDFESVSRIMKMMELMKNQPKDPRCELLLSLRPMLSSDRQRRVDDAVRIISLMSLLPLLNELGGG